MYRSQVLQGDYGLGFRVFGDWQLVCGYGHEGVMVAGWKALAFSD